MNIHQIIVDSVKNMLDKTISPEKIKNIMKKHDQKVHFIPYKYRIFGGILQSLNIQFGNFIETLVQQIIIQDQNLTILKECGKKKLIINSKTDRIIDEYITKRQVNMSLKSFEQDFNKLLIDIFNSEKSDKSSLEVIKHDIDMIFKTKDGVTHYIEFKYTDDHDTGKFADINRKFLKTYAGLINYLGVQNFEDLVPSIYYFNNIIKKCNI